MNFYEKLPNEVLIDFYNEINKNIEKGILTKNMYYELGIIFSVMYQRGIVLSKPLEFEHVSNQQMMNNCSA